jgi:hypothetical protein
MGLKNLLQSAPITNMNEPLPKPFISRIAKRANNNRMLRLRMNALEKKQVRLKFEKEKKEGLA